MAQTVNKHSTNEKAKGSARKVLQKSPSHGWRTSDDDEIALRRWRGSTEIAAIQALEPEHGPFGTFRVRSNAGSAYDVEIRDLTGRDNSCGCIDHRVNGLGTCKHIEGVLAALAVRRRTRGFKARAGAGSPRVEVFIRRADRGIPAILYPKGGPDAQARAFLRPFCKAGGALKPSLANIQALLAAASSAPSSVRVSRHIGAWLERELRLAGRQKARAQFLADIEAGRATWDMLKQPLLPYQQEGAAHLAFHERALLADEMGLGKTIQAIAACELLARQKGVERVLVVSPTSVKAEWEDQIARFTDREAVFVAGLRPHRLKLYSEPAFFTLVNYEQVVRDANDINRLLKPDVVILDEAQRIKNWQTKTAREVKSLKSPFAFVLTGTPLENRIDETYSIVQYLDPEIFGPLFRFNRDFYELDERGRPVGYQNLDAMHRRLTGIMLRRRKRDVEKELPGRTVKTFFVPMADEQAARYGEYEYRAHCLAAIAQRRLLTKEEFERLQQLLACMRMICDTPAILDPECRICPKLEELERVLEELLEDGEHKIVVFSEWVRMLDLVRELATEMGVEYAWHTGGVPQLRRRAEIARFREHPACRLFLTSDAGATGLNLQAASCVINLDLPWNPARLEQRIARVWRKGQARAVTVVNFVTEKSIEHSIMHLLEHKQTLADGVLDGTDDFTAIKMPSGRAAMIERMQALLGEKSTASIRVLSPEEALVEDMRARHGAQFVRAELRAERLVLVLDVDAATAAAEQARLAQEQVTRRPPVELISQTSWEMLQRLAQVGLVQFTPAPARLLHCAEAAPENAGVATASAA
jgi:superfamily II DNA or RNA helicase